MTSRAWVVLLVVVGTGCTNLRPSFADGGGGGGGGMVVTSCAADTGCPNGMVCESCPNGATSCVPGCRTTDQCKAGQLCKGGVVCSKCPCPPGWCEPDPCLDLDNDGYVQSCKATDVCPGKQLCDCDDLKPNVHPGQAEVCSNGIDDNCDGKYEWQDPACVKCPGGQSQCANVFACNNLGSLTCDSNSGCCSACPASAPPVCSANKCLSGGGINPQTGCRAGAVCVDCNACPKNLAPVCGVNGATYDNDCNAQLANVLVLHDGACLSGEGMQCDLSPVGSTLGCGTTGTLYCRDACPQCGARQNRCTKLGVCAWDGDCPAAQASKTCADGGVAFERCVNHACVADCS